jgi:hypothetical protein
VKDSIPRFNANGAFLITFPQAKQFLTKSRQEQQNLLVFKSNSSIHHITLHFDQQDNKHEKKPSHISQVR